MSTLAQAPDHPSEISVTFTPGGEGCRFHFEHGGWTDDRGKFSEWPPLLERFVDLADSDDT